MARPQVADGGGGLQIWRVAAYILNKQVRTADRGCLSSLGLAGEATTSHRKTSYLLRNVAESLGPERILQHELSNGKWTQDLEHGTIGTFIAQAY
jgi:hypothetical protein